MHREFTMFHTLWAAACVASACAAPAPPAATDADIERLIRQLGSDEFAEREEATRGLEAVGEPALPALRKAAAAGDAEVRLRASALVRKLGGAVSARAAAAVQKLGGRVERNDADPDRPVIGVVFVGVAVTDDDLAVVEGFFGLRRLYLQNTKVTDAGLAHLESSADLEELYVIRSPVGDAGVAHLARLTNLRRLYVIGGKVTDDGLARLRGLTALEQLDLDESPIADAGLAHLKLLKGLKHLGLDGTKATDAGVAALQKERPELEIQR
jgi:hypothetical protein